MTAHEQASEWIDWLASRGVTISQDEMRAMFEKPLLELHADRDYFREHAAVSDHEFLQMSDWLIGNAEFDLKTGLIDHAAKLRERIRDLIANDGEVEELRAQLAAAIKFIEDMVDECAYGDNCPDFGSNHGKCLNCKAREFIAAMAQQKGGG